MKKIALLLSVLTLSLTACGYAAKGSEATGQVKKIVKRTPIICDDYAEVDISLGVMRNGVGSMSHEDVMLYVSNPADVALLETAAKDSSIVTVQYDQKRLTFCVPEKQVTSVHVEQAEAAK